MVSDLATEAERSGDFAQVGEWLKPTDCKSVPPCEVRRFESFPVHQEFSFSEKIDPARRGYGDRLAVDP